MPQEERRKFPTSGSSAEPQQPSAPFVEGSPSSTSSDGEVVTTPDTTTTKNVKKDELSNHNNNGNDLTSHVVVGLSVGGLVIKSLWNVIVFLCTLILWNPLRLVIGDRRRGGGDPDRKPTVRGVSNNNNHTSRTNNNTDDADDAEETTSFPRSMSDRLLGDDEEGDDDGKVSDLTADERSQQDRLRREVNERLRATAAQFCQSKTLKLHVATWNVANQAPPPPTSEGGACLRRWLLGETLTNALAAASAADAKKGSVVPIDAFPDVLVVGLQEVEFGGVALMVETTESSVAWTEAVTDCLNDAVQWRVRFKKLKTIQLVGIVLIVIVRAEHEPFVSHVRTSLSRTGAINGVLGNKGSIGLRMTLYGKRCLFICAHFHPHLNNATTRMKNYHNALAELRFELGRDADDEFDIVRQFDEAHAKEAEKLLRQQEKKQNGGAKNSGGYLASSRQSSRTAGQSAWSRFFSRRSRSSTAVLLKELRVLESHDYVFFFGDLNYRLHGKKGDVIRRDLALPVSTTTSTTTQATIPISKKKAAAAAIPSVVVEDEGAILAEISDWKRSHQDAIGEMMQHHDELAVGMTQGNIFRGFDESLVTFPPTYKYDRGTVHRYDSSSKQREPAWTDRILYRVWDDDHPLSELVENNTNNAAAAAVVATLREGSLDDMQPERPYQPSSLPTNVLRHVFSTSSVAGGPGRSPPLGYSVPTPLLPTSQSLTTPRRHIRSSASASRESLWAADNSNMDVTTTTADHHTMDHRKSFLLTPVLDDMDALTATAAGVSNVGTSPLLELLSTAAAAPGDSTEDSPGVTAQARPQGAIAASSSISPQKQSSSRLMSANNIPLLLSGNSSLHNYPMARHIAFGGWVPNALTPLAYDSIHSLTLSDHKPVMSIFEMSVVTIDACQSEQVVCACRDLWDKEGHCGEDGHM